MREGTNPTKLVGAPPSYGPIRVIVPVWIPTDEGYFNDSAAVLEATLQSLAATIDDRVRVSVIDNASCLPVAAALRRHRRSGLVDRLIVNRVNRGKVDAVLSELRASFEELLVVLDADVALRSGWVDSLLSAMSTFPECGLLSFHPSAELQWHASSSLLLGWRRGTRLVLTSLLDSADQRRFLESVGRQYSSARPHLAVIRDGTAIVPGVSHFAMAIRREAVNSLPYSPSSKLYGSDSAYFEIPVDAAGWWCGAFPRSLAHHIGNRLDDEERLRIHDFRSYSVSDYPGFGTVSLVPGPPSPLLPRTLRPALLRILRKVLELRHCRRLFIRENGLLLREGSALRVDPADPGECTN